MKRKLYVQTFRFLFNLMPCIWCGGGRVTHLSEDFTQLRTKNRLGTIYGGSMYSSTDPMYMLMLMEILGKDFVVWDKGCTIRFKRPAKTTLFAEFKITPQMLAGVREAVTRDQETTFTWKAEYKDREGAVYAEFDKVLYVASKEFYRQKMAKRKAQKLPGKSA
jgi:hypothetical protein